MKYSLRSLMIVVTVAAFGIWGGVTWQQHRVACLARAKFHAQQRDQSKLRLDSIDRFLARVGLNGDKLFARATFRDKISIESRVKVRKEVMNLREAVQVHQNLATSYENAIWRPWERLWIRDQEAP